jgi:hypothetical protein
MSTDVFLLGNKARWVMKPITHLHLLLEVKKYWSYTSKRR